jgi:hypothetical protein
MEIKLIDKSNNELHEDFNVSTEDMDIRAK